MLCKVQKALIPDNLTLFPATENSSSHVIENQPEGTAFEIFESHTYALKQRCLPLISERREKQLAAVAGNNAKHMNLYPLAIDLNMVRRPVQLHFLPGVGFEAPFGCGFSGYAIINANVCNKLAKNGSGTGITDISYITQNSRGGKPQQNLLSNYLLKLRKL